MMKTFKLKYSDIKVSTLRPISKLIRKEIIKVRYIVNKPTQNGKTQRDMVKMSSSDGKVLNINIAAYVRDAVIETRELLRTVIYKTAKNENQTKEEYIDIRDFWLHKVSEIEFFELLAVYSGLQKYEKENDKYGMLTLIIPRQEIGQEVERYGNFAKKLNINNYY